MEESWPAWRQGLGHFHSLGYLSLSPLICIVLGSVNLLLYSKLESVPGPRNKKIPLAHIGQVFMSPDKKETRLSCLRQRPMTREQEVVIYSKMVAKV